MDFNKVDWNNKEDVLEAIKNDGEALKYASEELRGDKEVVLTALETNKDDFGIKYTLKYASEELRGDREVVLAAINGDGRALKYASKELRQDRELVLTAMSKYGNAISYASQDMQEEVLVALNKELLKDWGFKRGPFVSLDEVGIKELEAIEVSELSDMYFDDMSMDEEEEERYESEFLTWYAKEELKKYEKAKNSSSEKEAETEETKEDENETERQETLQRVKGKIETAKQKKAELDALRGQAEIQVEEDEKEGKDTHEEEQL